jgi:hypothetical protein
MKERLQQEVNKEFRKNERAAAPPIRQKYYITAPIVRLRLFFFAGIC